MTFNLTIPQISGASLDLPIDVGQTIFILGANGSGKSSLMQKFYAMNSGTARQLSAHRQNWFNSSSLTLSPQQKREIESHLKHSDSRSQARWMDDYSAQRASIAIYDLIDAENIRARSITGAVDQGNITLAQKLSNNDAPIKIINELLRLSNIPIAISIKENDTVVATRPSGQCYSAAELSDGERNALIVAANVLTTPANTLILIDEPERHLHRSIISPLLTLLFTQRQDCAFIVATHDVMLPSDNPTAQTLLVRECTYSGSNVTAWETDLVPGSTEIDERLKTDILGARRKLLFVEGAENSLDKPLYSLIFPNVSVIAKSSCHDVEHAVGGIRNASGFHWLHAWGIVDNDRRTVTDIEEIKGKGVYAIPVFSVESIYYHPVIQDMVVVRHAAIIGADSSTAIRLAKEAALAAIKPHVGRLCQRALEKKLRDEMFKYIPRKEKIAAMAPINVKIDVAAVVAEERTRLEGYLDADNLEPIIQRYPVRETPALKVIAEKLGFRGRVQYESAVRKLLMDDVNALKIVKDLFGALVSEIEASV